MAVVNLVRRAREIGRIRMGDKGQRGNPQRLENFRLTSADRRMLEEAAKLYGGTVRPWQEQAGQFELYLTADELPCMVAPQEVSQWYEHWSGGGCQRRCDGILETISNEPCPCDPENRECKLTTRLSVMLHQLPGIGTWRLETHGFYAATELPATAELLIGLAQRGQHVEATLAIEQRIVKREGKTKKFPVPVLRIRQALATLMTGEVIEPPKLPAHERAVLGGERFTGLQISGGDTPALPAGEALELEAPRASDERRSVWGTSNPGSESRGDAAAQNGEAVRCAWMECGKTLTSGQISVSQGKCGRPDICPKCQKDFLADAGRAA